ncbi:MAG: PRC-barrel domain-containing protein [Verrucomicrobia bacterium]|nr:PRC-barrel domain-containing protein [Verrucomicrobiota bacterium]
MSTFDDLTDQTFPSIFGRKVIDERGDDIGTLDALWTGEDTGKVEFLGVKTGWIFGKTHIVPAHSAELQEDHVRVPYQADFVKDAPSFPAHEELSAAQEDEVYDYYGITREEAEATTGETFPTAGEAGGDAGTLAGTTGTGLRAEREDSVENPVVGRGPAGAREPIGEPTVPGVRSSAMPGDRDISDERGDLIGQPGAGTGSIAETERPSGGPAIAPGMDIAPEAGPSGAGTRDLGVGRVRLRKFWRGERDEVLSEVEREPSADQTRTGRGLEDTGQAGLLEPTGAAGTGTGAGTAGAGSSGLTGAESEAERGRERERLDR